MELAFGSTIAVGRRGHLGDVLVCMPLLASIKRQRPDLRICMVASPYTLPVLSASEWVDEVLPDHLVIEDPAQLSRRDIRAFINPLSDESLARAAYQAGVPLRVGDVERPAAARWCNRFVWSRRKWSKLHEAQIVLRHIGPLGLETRLQLSELKLLTRLSRIPALDDSLRRYLCDSSFNLVIHPKSLKNGREWPARHFLRLVELLQDAPIRILLTGMDCERQELLTECPGLLQHPAVTVLMGATAPSQFIALIAHADGLIAGSTGPLHIAAALGIHALGLFPRRAAIGSRRWQALGEKSETLQMAGSCIFPLNTCELGDRSNCRCMAKITPEQVAARVRCWLQDRPCAQGLRGGEATAA